MSILPRALFFGILLATVWMAPAAAMSYAEKAAAISAAESNLEQAAREMDLSSKALEEAIRKVETAPHFEGPQWVALDQALKTWEAEIPRYAERIDRNARIILRLEPSRSIQSPEPPLVGGAFKSLRDRMREIQADLEAAIVRAEQTKQRQFALKGAVQMEMKEGMAEVFVYTALDIANVPTSLEDAGKNVTISVATLAGRWYAKPLDLLATGITFGVRMYYLADQLQSGTRSLKSAEEVTAFTNEFISRTQADIASAQQGIQLVERMLERQGEVRRNYFLTMNGWRAESEAGAKRQTEETVQAFEQELAKPDPAITVSGHWPAPHPAPIQPGEYAAEAESILRELQSAALAAIDGGSPIAFYEIKRSRLEGLQKRLDDANKTKEKAGQTNQAARGIYNAQISAISASHRSCWISCGQRWTYRVQGWWDCTTACEASAVSAGDAAKAGLIPSAIQYGNAERESMRQGLIYYRVSDGARDMEEVIRKAGEMRSGEFWLLWNQHQRQFEVARAAIGEVTASLPPMYQLDSFKNWANVDAQIKGAFLFRKGLGTVREWLRGQVHTMRDTAAQVRRNKPIYQTAMQEADQLSREARQELTTFSDKFALLMWGHHPQTTESQVADYQKWIKKRIEDEFANSLPYSESDLARINNFPYEETASHIEAGIEQLDDLLARLDVFRYRLNAASAALQRASQSLLAEPINTQRSQPLTHRAVKELREGAWSGFTSELEGLASDDSLRPTLQNKYNVSLPYDGTPPRRLLMATQGTLHQLADSYMRDYLAARSNRSFVRVDEHNLKLLDSAWQRLKPLHGRFESLATHERTKLAQGAALLPDESAVSRAYTTLPEALRSDFAYEWGEYRKASNELRQYVALKQENLAPVTGDFNDVLRNLQDWIEGYPAALRDYQERQAREQAEFEEQQKRYEAEEKARAEATERARQEELQAASTAEDTVRRFYLDFAATYQARNLSGLVRFMTENWKTADGADLRDLEDNLDNSFRVFDRILFSISGLTIRSGGSGLYQVSYTATITGHINQMNLKHQETAQVEDTVILTPEGPIIQSTRGGRLWLQQ